MKKSKFVGRAYGAWTCTEYGVASVQGNFCKYKKENGKRARSKYPASRQYWYALEKRTSDGAIKQIRLSAYEMKQVLEHKHTVEYYVMQRTRMAKPTYTERVSYNFPKK